MRFDGGAEFLNGGAKALRYSEQVAAARRRIAVAQDLSPARSRWRRTLALSLLGLFLASIPLGAQLEMPDAKQMSGIPRPDGTLPDGTVTIRLIRGQLSNNIVDHPVELRIGTDTRTMKTDETGRAQFSDLTPGATMRAVAVVDGEQLESPEFAVPAQGGVRMLLVASAPREAGMPAPRPPTSGIVILGGDSRVVVEFADDTMQVFYLFDIVNNARAPVNPASALIFDMPSGAQGTSVLEGSTKQAVARGSRVIVSGPFQPGTTSVQIAYQMPYSGGMLQMAQKLPATMARAALIVQKIGALHVTSPQIAEHGEMPAQGRTYIMGNGPAIPAGGTLTLDFTGLPHRSGTARSIALGLVLAIIGAGVWASMGTGEHDQARRRQLETRREKLLGELVRLEQQRQAGHLEAAGHAARRQALVAQLERVYGELDASGRAAGGDEGLAA